MNEPLKIFYKFTDSHEVNWNESKTLYCIGLSCKSCVIEHCWHGNGASLTDIDIKFIKEHSPEYFI